MAFGDGWFAQEYPVGTKIPWSLFVFKNRWTRLLIYAISGLFTSLFFNGFQDISDMMFREGVFSSKCPQPWNGEICDAQYEAAWWCYTVAIIGCGLNSLTGGILVDTIGPMMTALVGELSFIVGLALWAASSPSVQMYYPAFFFLASGVNPLAIPLLEIRHMFPGWESLIVSIVLAPQTVAPVVPLLLNRIQINHPNISTSAMLTGYLLVIVIPTTILVVLALPVWRFPAPLVAPPSDQAVAVLDTHLVHGFEDDPISKGDRLDDTDEDTTGLPPPQSEGPAAVSPFLPALQDADVDALPPVSSAVAEDQPDLALPTTPVHSIPGADQLSSPSSSASIIEHMADDAGLLVIPAGSINEGPTAGDQPPEPTAAVRMRQYRVDWVLLGFQMRTPEFWLFATFTVVTAIQIGYYPSTIRAWGTDAEGEALSRFYGIITPTQFVYGIVLGFLVAYTTAVGMTLVLCGMAALLFTFALIPSYGLQYASCMLGAWIQSYIFTLQYIFVSEKFDNRNFGTLVGILGTFPALGYPILFGIQMPTVFTTLYIILLCVTSISVGCGIALLVRQLMRYDMEALTLSQTDAYRLRALQKKEGAPVLTDVAAVPEDQVDIIMEPPISS